MCKGSFVTDPVNIKCPGCDRWLAEGMGYIRGVCRDCGYEVTVKDKEARRLTVKRVAAKP